jgi:hypothetical protein
MAGIRSESRSPALNIATYPTITIVDCNKSHRNSAAPYSRRTPRFLVADAERLAAFALRHRMVSCLNTAPRYVDAGGPM